MSVFRATDGKGNVINFNPVPLEFATPGTPYLDLYSMANALFGSESLLLQRFDIHSMEIPLYAEYADSVDHILRCLFRSVLRRDIEVAYSKNTDHWQVPVSKFLRTSQEKDGCTCLFSTGIDSYSTILTAASQFKRLKGCFVSHNDMPNLRGLENDFAQHLSASKGTEVIRINAANHGQFIRRSRGVFYLLYGMLLGNDKVIMGEAGVTMYQPRFTILDEVTITAHPGLVTLVSELTKGVLSAKPRVILPCENMTKAEVVAACPSSAMMASTFSCSGTTMFATSDAAHCGSCFSCIVRRLAFMVSGVQDCFYPQDIGSWNISRSALDNIVHLMHFSATFAFDSDALPRYAMETIRDYGKEDLFRRFALDNLAGLLLLSEREGFGGALSKMRERSRACTDDSVLRERIEVVRSRTAHMDFEKTT